MSAIDTHLLELLLQFVRHESYQFTTVTPVTHQRILSRRLPENPDLRDIFGWNVGFQRDSIPGNVLAAMDKCAVVADWNGHLKSTIRIASLDLDLFIHSAFPTVDSHAVFFGPDTYRFARFINKALRDSQVIPDNDVLPNQTASRAIRILDIGCGTGAGGIVAARAIAPFSRYELTMTDINPQAIEFAQVNVRFAGMSATFALGDTFSNVEGQFDVIVANPPYVCDEAKREYRHGGGSMGLDLSVRICEEALPRLVPGGTLILYTGVAMVSDIDPLQAELKRIGLNGGYDFHYEEIDPDVFGEELDRPAYFNAERIAAVGVRVKRHAVGQHAA
jgi:methylase of polypeptide subunit release factors